jgi:hypothetical protein
MRLEELLPHLGPHPRLLSHEILPTARAENHQRIVLLTTSNCNYNYCLTANC